MTRLGVWTVAELTRCAPALSEGEHWLYVGKDLVQRGKIEPLLGGKKRLLLNDRLHRIAEVIRQPFLEFVAELGKIQPDEIEWWSSSCSWKDVGRSDLFLLICYEHLIDELRRDCKDRHCPLLVIVEDLWLFHQLKKLYAGLSDVEFHGNPWLWSARLKALVLGTGARFIWTMRLAQNYLVQRWFWRWEPAPPPLQPVLGLYTYPQARCLRENEGWLDPYLGKLDTVLEGGGYQVVRFTPPEISGFERALAQRSSYFLPLILFLRPLDLLRALFATWNPVWPADLTVSGLPVRYLLLREWWQDRWRSSYTLFRLFHDLMGNLLRTKAFKLIIYPYENQPWEKMLVLAARVQRVPTLGYQHSSGLSHFHLGHFHGAGESVRIPLADWIVASGPYTCELMAQGGTPYDRLVVGGNFRHQYLWTYKGDVPSPSSASHVVILVMLPIERELTEHLLAALCKAFPDGGLKDGIDFMIKPHPICPLTEGMLKFPAVVLSGNFEETLGLSSIVLYCGTGAAMEAFVTGHLIIRYRSELLLDLDAAEFLKGHAVIDCTDYDLRDKVLQALHSDVRPDKEEINTVLEKIFPPPDKNAWLRTIQGSLVR